MSDGSVEEKVWADILAKAGGKTDTLPKRLIDAAQREHEANSEQRRKLRKIVCYWLIGLLALEIYAMFFMVMCQGAKWIELNEVTFGILSTGVLIQTSYSFRTIVTHLFPDGQRFTK